MTTLLTLAVAGALLAGCGGSSGSATSDNQSGASPGATTQPGTAQPGTTPGTTQPGTTFGQTTPPATLKPAKVVVNGAELQVSGSVKPHQHEDAPYAPAKELAAALKVDATVDDKGPVVTVNGTALKAGTNGPKGTHEHGGVVFVKVEDFAKAAGYKFAWDAATGTATLSK